ncbi:MAG: hypothetical protein ERJ67_07590 [Aphanocapsa feldmannii 277cV]|uniref:Uncharacterized protein n=2 Tax=Aphanocapsa feldmannii TaxID=192050 RepID=A0A524RMI5_9CHRO|nr:MAG: hypothetical protein ERJ67_07590 [Aphanocapsa feldmannii 277cV]TGH22725.1 MAG: hypothetical protein ERJ68_04405 [Aphanocapsa feldmannii 277cI]
MNRSHPGSHEPSQLPHPATTLIQRNRRSSPAAVVTAPVLLLALLAATLHPAIAATNRVSLIAGLRLFNIVIIGSIVSLLATTLALLLLWVKEMQDGNVW